MANRDARSGKFKYPNRPMTPGEKKPDIKHLDLRDSSAPVVQHFKKQPLEPSDGQARQSPSNE